MRSRTRWRARSHQLAGKAQQDGVFADEIAPIEIPQRKGDPVTVSEDQGVRPDSTAEGLGKLRAAFTKDGTITAGNSSPISDGAAAVVLTTRARTTRRSTAWTGSPVGRPGQVAGPDTSLHSQPSRAIEHALSRSEWSAAGFGLHRDQRGVRRGLRSPSGTSAWTWTRSTSTAARSPWATPSVRPVFAYKLHAATELARRGSGKAAVSLCGGGGQGEALLLSR